MHMHMHVHMHVRMPVPVEATDLQVFCWAATGGRLRTYQQRRGVFTALHLLNVIVNVQVYIVLSAIGGTYTRR